MKIVIALLLLLLIICSFVTGYNAGKDDMIEIYHRWFESLAEWTEDLMTREQEYEARANQNINEKD